MSTLEIELSEKVRKAKLIKDLYFFVKDIILSAKCYVISLLFVFLVNLLFLFFARDFPES